MPNPSLTGNMTYIIAVLGALAALFGITVDVVSVTESALIVWNAIMVITMRLGIKKAEIAAKTS